MRMHLHFSLCLMLELVICMDDFPIVQMVYGLIKMMEVGLSVAADQVLTKIRF